MNIGYIHKDFWPLNSAHSIISWQILSRLKKRHNIFVPSFCYLPGFNQAYFGKRSIFSFAKKIDLLLIMIDGVFDLEKFSIISLLRSKKIPLVWYIHAPVEELLLFSNHKRELYIKMDVLKRKILSKLVDAAICVSEEIQRYASQDLGIENSYLVPNGADPQIFDPSKTEGGVLDKFSDYFKVVWIGGGYWPWQGLDLIVKLAERVRKIDNKVLFIVMTDESWYNIPTLDNLLVLRGVNHKEVPRYLKSADACLCLYNFPNCWQYDFYNSPMKLFEYMAMAKPVIASGLGQIRKVIKDGDNGLLVDNSLSDLLKKLLFLKKHPSLSKQIGIRARKTVIDYYNWSRVAKEIEDILIQVVNA